MDYRPFLLTGILAAIAVLAPATASSLAADDDGAVVVKTSHAQEQPQRENRLRDDAYAALRQALAETPELPAVPGYPAGLLEVWQLAAAQHPSIRLVASGIAEMQQKLDPASAPPDPVLSFMLMNHPVADPFSWDSPMTGERIGIMQMLERSSKRKARRAMAEVEVEAQRDRLASAKYAIGGKLLDSWFELAEADVRLQQLERNEKLLEALREVVRLSFEVNRAPQADLLAAEEKLAELKQMRADITAMRETARAMLAMAAGVKLEELPEFGEMAVPEFAFTEPDSWDGVAAEAAALHPDSALYDTMLELVRAGRRVIKLDYRPDPTVEAAWTFNPKNMDTFSLGFSIPLPLHNDKKLDPKVSETYIKEEQVALMREELTVDIRSEVQVQAAKLRTIPERRRVLDALTLPLLKQTFDSQLAAYQTRKVPLADLLRTTMDIIDTETALMLLDVEEARAEATLDYLTFGLLRRTE
jgi:cobalt-zinc-cadmium efflux system outer membrane protein